MTPDDQLYRFRQRTLALAEEVGSVRAACRMMGIHHSTFYRWRKEARRASPPSWPGPSGAASSSPPAVSGACCGAHGLNTRRKRLSLVAGYAAPPGTGSPRA